MNHTPAPWVSEGHLIYGPKHEKSHHKNGRVLIAEVKQGTIRADPHLDGGADRFGFDSSADVAIMTAAPELLAMLTRLQVSLGNFCCDNCISYDDMEESHTELLDASKAADELLKKVRGQ